MRVVGGKSLGDPVIDTTFEVVVDVEGASSVTVTATEEGRACVIFRDHGQEIGVYLTGDQLDTLVRMWDKPHRLDGGLPLAYFWKEPK